MIRHENFLMVTVMEGAFLFSIYDDGKNEPQLRFNIPGDAYFHVIHLQKGKYKLMGLASELSEDQWKEIVKEEYGGFAGHIKGYRWYDGPVIMDAEPAKTAKESGQSLLRSHNLKPETTIILTS